DDAVDAGADRRVHHHAAGGAHPDGAGRQVGADDIGEEHLHRRLRPWEVESREAAHGAVSSVAAHEVGGPQGDVAVGSLGEDFDRVVGVGDFDDFVAAADVRPQFHGPFGEDALGDPLGDAVGGEVDAVEDGEVEGQSTEAAGGRKS